LYPGELKMVADGVADLQFQCLPVLNRGDRSRSPPPSRDLASRAGARTTSNREFRRSGRRVGHGLTRAPSRRRCQPARLRRSFPRSSDARTVGCVGRVSRSVRERLRRRMGYRCLGPLLRFEDRAMLAGGKTGNYRESRAV
jgi:hypothetical protein